MSYRKWHSTIFMKNRNFSYLFLFDIPDQVDSLKIWKVKNLEPITIIMQIFLPRQNILIKQITNLQLHTATINSYDKVNWWQCICLHLHRLTELRFYVLSDTKQVIRDVLPSQSLSTEPLYRLLIWFIHEIISFAVFAINQDFVNTKPH